MTRRAEQKHATTAARLVLPELLENRHLLQSALEIKRWRFIEFQCDRWRQHELTIASGLGREWQQLTSVYTALILFNMERHEMDEEAEINLPEDLEHLELALINLDEAIEALAKWAGLSKVEVITTPDYADRLVGHA